MLRLFFPELVLSTDLLSLNIPRYFYIALPIWHFCLYRGFSHMTGSDLFFLGHRSRIVYCVLWSRVVRRQSSVRLSSVSRPLDNLHFQLLLQNRLMDFDETWYGWSTQGPLQVLLCYGQIPLEADPRRGKYRSQGVSFFKELLLQTRMLQQQTECIAVI